MKVHHKVGHHAFTLIALTIYFSLFFLAINYLRFAILQKEGIPFYSFGLGLIPALICAKFMMIARAIYPIKATKNKALCWHILNRTIIYLIVVIILTIFEQGFTARLHGTKLSDSIIGLAPGTINQFCAIALIYWLMLVPYVTYSALNQAIGESRLFNILFSPGKLNSTI